MEALLEQIAQTILSHVYIAPLLAFAAGLLTSITPCSLSSVPLIIAYVGGTGSKNTKRALYLSIAFAVGSAVTFTILGVFASMAGSLIGTSAKWWYIALGILMVLMALQMWGIYEIIPANSLLLKNNKKGYVGAFLAGVLGGIFSSPCSTPVLIALLALVAGEGSLSFAVLLLLLYSIGHGILAVIAGTSFGLVQKLVLSSQYNHLSNVIKIVMGVLILVMALYMFYLGF